MRTMPGWFRVTALVLVLWNLVGAYACIQQFRLGAEALGSASDYDRALYASMPVWYNWIFAAAEVTGVTGAVALLTGRRAALPLLIASLGFVVIQFGYLFAITDIIAAKGLWTIYFPAFIATTGLVQIGLARMGISRGWLA